MTRADRPPAAAYLLNVLRRREDVLWAGEREGTETPTVIASDVEAIRADLPAAADAGWHWVESRWSWADVKAASAGVTRVGSRIRSVSVGPREDDTFGITLELDGPDAALETYVATLEPGLVRLTAPGARRDGFPSEFAATGFPLGQAGDLRLDDPRPDPEGVPPLW